MRRIVRGGFHPGHRAEGNLPIVRLGVFFLMLMLVPACAGRGKRLPRGTKAPPVMEREAGPERRASESLVEAGGAYLEHGLFDRAADTFQEAANLDPTNGAAFYYLALVKYRMGEYGEVWDYLEKAEALLSGDRDWSERLESLRREVHEAKPRP